MGKRIDLLQGTLDMLVLRVLAEGATHGYGVARRIQCSSGDVLEVEEGSLYPALHRLEKRGWVTASWGTSENNRRAKFYALTAEGRQALNEEAAGWAVFTRAVSRVMGYQA